MFVIENIKNQGVYNLHFDIHTKIVESKAKLNKHEKNLIELQALQKHIIDASIVHIHQLSLRAFDQDIAFELMPLSDVELELEVVWEKEILEVGDYINLGAVKVNFGSYGSAVLSFTDITVENGSKKAKGRIAIIFSGIVAVSSIPFIPEQYEQYNQTFKFRDRIKLTDCASSVKLEYKKTNYVLGLISSLPNIKFPKTKNEAKNWDKLPSENVCTLQLLLNRLVPRDKNKIVVDGIIGPETFEAFDIYRKTTAPSATYNELMFELINDAKGKRDIISSLIDYHRSLSIK